MSNISVSPALVTSLTTTFNRLLDRFNFRPLSRLAERHGSWEWSFGRTDSLNRFVFISVTDIGAPAEIDEFAHVIETIFVLETRVAADNDKQFARQSVGSSRGPLSTLVGDGFTLSSSAIELIERAAAEVEKFTQDQLSGEYLPSNASEYT